MKIKECIRNKIAKKIRRILLISVDNEMKKKTKDKHYILINSKNPIDLELENNFLLKQGPIYTPTLYFTNIAEKYLVERVFDKNKKINYFYSDNLGKNNGMLILKQHQRNFLTKYSSIDLKMDIGILLNNENSIKDSYNTYLPLYSFPLIKKNIGEMKIINSKSITKYSDNHISIEQKDFKNLNNKEKNTNLKFRNYLMNLCYIKLKKRILKRGSDKGNNRLKKGKYITHNNIIENLSKKKGKKTTNSILKNNIKEIKADGNSKLFKCVTKENHDLINNKFKKCKRVLSGKISKLRFSKQKTNYDINKENELLRIPMIKEKRKNHIFQKRNTRKINGDMISTVHVSSPEKIKILRKFKIAHI